MQKFTFVTTVCCVQGEFLPSTPQFLWSRIYATDTTINGVRVEIFQVAQKLTQGRKILWGWKTKSYLEDIVTKTSRIY